MKKILKNIYNNIPLKKEMFSVIRFFGTPPKSVYKHLFFNGKISIKAKKGVSFKMMHYGYEVENEIFWNGLYNGWEKVSLKLWAKLCESNHYIFDVGANTGIYSLVAKAINRDARVYAFEPVKRIYDKLNENIQLNKFDIIPVQKALSDKTGTAIIYDLSSEHVYSVTVNKNLAQEGCQVLPTEISTVTLYDFVEENGIPRIDLIKIDVETHEPEVLRGFTRLLEIHKPVILIEILTNEIGAEVQSLVEGLGYLYFNIDENGGIRRVVSISKSDYYNYLLCNNTVAKELGLI